MQFRGPAPNGMKASWLRAAFRSGVNLEGKTKTRSWFVIFMSTKHHMQSTHISMKRISTPCMIFSHPALLLYLHHEEILLTRKLANGVLVNPTPRPIGLLLDTQNCGLRMRRKSRERFPRHGGLAIPACITARAWCTCRDACRDR